VLRLVVYGQRRETTGPRHPPSTTIQRTNSQSMNAEDLALRFSCFVVPTTKSMRQGRQNQVETMHATTDPFRLMLGVGCIPGLLTSTTGRIVEPSRLLDNQRGRIEGPDSCSQTR
jgi:hypothetical protein